MDQGSTSSAGTKAREEAQAALKACPGDSLFGAFKVALGASAFLGVAIPGLTALQIFTTPVLWGMASALSASWLFGYIFFEFQRLLHCRRALKYVLSTEKFYEDLLRDTRDERDQAINARIVTEARASFQTEAAKLVAVLQEQLIQVPKQPVRNRRRAPKE
ncbi:hypothetical protein QEG98_17035 [Myxococcus sp. MxC21-1]|uniref:hypothetical protein n=1 Tax=Myxococcus sp. MxC21-1 TaxID=3041439 RepID=UPI00292F917D|nr:hypothetical protein [Myxococcus sp. MxC21-1]WNZ65182.1 hypothetical protein QEG98_17035 [Myxococcus sp. MxC21-1]